LSAIHIKAPLESDDTIIENDLQHGQVVLAHSVMSTQLTRIREEVRVTRDRFGKQVIMIAGGPHASARPKDLLEMGFDFVVVGEGESSFREILWYLDHDKEPTEIPGVIGPSTTDLPIPKQLERVSLDDYPPFALDANIVGPIEVTRGCAFRCKFCATPFLSGGTVRHRSVQKIVHWLKKAVDKSGFERTWFLSPNALCYGGRGIQAEPAKLEHLLKESKSVGIDIFFGSFPSEVRPEFVTPDLLEMFRGYVANKTVQIGLQSGSNRILQLANRHHSVQEGLDAINIATDTGFIPHVDMIFGLPGETEKDIEASLRICESLAKQKAKVHAHVFMPLPGSEWENMPAGRLDSHTRQILGEMSRKKIVTGSWSHQEIIGPDLEAFE